jgi:hypothetical protein
VESDDLGTLPDEELRAEISWLQTEIAVREAKIETLELESRRTRRLLRGTFLTAAGFFGLSLDPISALVILVGIIDWIDVVKDDNAAMNSRIALQRDKTLLLKRLEQIEAEVRKRGGDL